MLVHHNPDKYSSIKRPVITIGSYDGLHFGHRKIINKVIDIANNQYVESLIITFSPHPREVIYPEENNLQLLNSDQEKIKLLEKLDIDHLVIYPFTLEFANLSPREYIEDFLVQNFKPSAIVIGYDHKFGKGRKGNIETLKEYSQKHDFEVFEIPAQDMNDVSVSSTKIRNALNVGDIEDANKWLCHPYPMIGTVIHGEKRGNSLGYPTANLSIKNDLKLIPPDGIYAVKVMYEDVYYKGMLYIGNKPTYNHQERVIEVNIFDFEYSIYEKDLWIEFIAYVRPDKKFASTEELVSQLDQDKKQTEIIFNEFN